MLSAIRKNQHSLTFLIVLLTIVSFIWLYNRTNLSQVGTNDVGLMYGKVLQRATLEREARIYRLGLALGLTELVRDMGGFAENEELALSSFIFNVLILEHEVKALQIIPTEKEIAAAIQALPLFQTQGVFDAEKYAHAMKETLAARGFTERQLEEVISDSLSLKKLKEVITSPVVVSEAQVREAARIYQPVEAQALFFNAASYLEEAKKQPLLLEEKKAFYEKNKKFFSSEDQRAVSYVVVALSLEQQKQETKERVHALQQLAERLTALKEKAKVELQGGKTFEKIAEEHGLKAIATGNFNKQGKEEAEPLSSDQKKKPSHSLPPELLEAAFKLTTNGALSEVIQSGPSLYLFTLRQATPSRTLSFSEAEKKVEQLLLQEKATRAMQQAARERVQKIREALTAGKSFSVAAATAGCKPESLPFLSPEKAASSSSSLSVPQKEAILATLPLQPRELSELKHTSLNDFVVYLQERTPLTEADWKQYHEQIEESFLQQEKELLFFEWMRKARTQAGITLFDGRHKRSLLQRVFGK